MINIKPHPFTSLTWYMAPLGKSRHTAQHSIPPSRDSNFLLPPIITDAAGSIFLRLASGSPLIDSESEDDEPIGLPALTPTLPPSPAAEEPPPVVVASSGWSCCCCCWPDEVGGGGGGPLDESWLWCWCCCCCWSCSSAASIGSKGFMAILELLLEAELEGIDCRDELLAPDSIMASAIIVEGARGAKVV